MSQLKIDTLNVKQLYIDGTAYHYSLGAKSLYSSDFLSDEKYVITSDMLVDGSFTITRETDDENIYSYSLKTSYSKENISIIKNTDRVFSIESENDMLLDVDYVYLGNELYSILTRSELEGIFTYTIDRLCESDYDSVTPVRGITIDSDKNIVMIPVLNSETVDVYYYKTFCDKRTMIVTPSEHMVSVEIELFSTIDEYTQNEINWSDVESDELVQVISSKLLVDDVITVDNGQVVELYGNSKLIIE
jgi:hypothetical protein